MARSYCRSLRCKPKVNSVMDYDLVQRTPANSWIYTALAKEASCFLERPNSPVVVVDTFKIVNPNPDVKFIKSHTQEIVVVICDGFLKIHAIFSETTKTKILENLDSADLFSGELDFVAIKYKVDIRECSFEDSSKRSQKNLCPETYEILILLEDMDCLGNKLEALSIESSQEMEKQSLWYYESIDCEPLLYTIIDERVNPVTMKESPPHKPKRRKIQLELSEEINFDQDALLSSQCLPSIGPSALSAESPELRMISGSISLLNLENSKEEEWRKLELSQNTDYIDPQPSCSGTSKYHTEREASRLENLLIPSNLSLEADMNILISESPKNCTLDSPNDSRDLDSELDLMEVKIGPKSDSNVILSPNQDVSRNDKPNRTARSNAKLPFSTESASEFNLTIESDVASIREDESNMNDSNFQGSLKLTPELECSFTTESSLALHLSLTESEPNQSLRDDSVAESLDISTGSVELFNHPGGSLLLPEDPCKTNRPDSQILVENPVINEALINRSNVSLSDELAGPSGERAGRKTKNVRGMIQGFGTDLRDKAGIGFRRCEYTFQIHAVVSNNDSEISMSERSHISENSTAEGANIEIVRLTPPATRNITIIEEANVEVPARSLSLVLSPQSSRLKESAEETPPAIDLPNTPVPQFSQDSSIPCAQASTSTNANSHVEVPESSFSSEIFLRSSNSAEKTPSAIDLPNENESVPVPVPQPSQDSSIPCAQASTSGNTSSQQLLDDDLRKRIIEILTSDRQCPNELILSPNTKAELVKHLQKK